MITCDEVYFDYDNSSILENINFTINKGEFVVIMETMDVENLLY